MVQDPNALRLGKQTHHGQVRGDLVGAHLRGMGSKAGLLPQDVSSERRF